MKSLFVQVGMKHIRTTGISQICLTLVFHGEVTGFLKGMKTRTAICETYCICPLALRDSSKVYSHHGTIAAVILQRLCAGIWKGMLSHKPKEDHR